MIPGMKVALNGKAWTVTRLTNTQLNGRSGQPVRATLYTLTREIDGVVYTEYVTATNAVKLGVTWGDYPHPELLAACPACGVSQGNGHPCMMSCPVGEDARAVVGPHIDVQVTDGFGHPREPQDLPGVESALATVYGEYQTKALMSEEPPL